MRKAALLWHDLPLPISHQAWVVPLAIGAVRGACWNLMRQIRHRTETALTVASHLASQRKLMRQIRFPLARFLSVKRAETALGILILAWYLLIHRLNKSTQCVVALP
jgi:hypothetical protein